MDEKRIQMLMELLEISREEAIDVIKKDEEIDKGVKHFELSAEQKKAEKKMRGGAKSAVNAYGKRTEVKRKADNDKAELMQKLFDLISESCTEVELTNPEREINFKMNGRKFKIVLSAPRK